MKMAVLITVAALHSPSLVFGQAGGIPFHVRDVTSTTPDPPLRKFTPATNLYARRILNEQFAFVDDIQKIDSKVLAVFHSKVPPGEIANRGQHFNATDIGRDNWPFRRFILAGNAPGMWFILYESGGIGYHHNLVVFAKDHRWHVVAAVAGFMKNNTFDSLKQSVKAGEFFDQRGYPQY